MLRGSPINAYTVATGNIGMITPYSYHLGCNSLGQHHIVYCFVTYRYNYMCVCTVCVCIIIILHICDHLWENRPSPRIK